MACGRIHCALLCPAKL